MAVIVTENLSGAGSGALRPMPAYRRFLGDMTDERGVIPAALLRHAELAALEEQRQRLIAALRDARSPSGPPAISDADYVAQRAQALRDGTEMPAPPPSQAATDEYRRRRARDTQAAEKALLALADDICDALREHPEWERESRSDVAALRAEAERKRREAAAADAAAEAGKLLVLWMERAAHDELYVVTTQ